MQREKQTDLERAPICWFIPKYLQWPGMGQAEANSRELKPGLPCGWQRPKYLSHLLVPPGVCINRKVELGVEPRLQPWHSDMRYGRFNSCLSC